jgi:hypothetical protein
MFTFCPLQGALSESSASQSLLELDGGVKVLIDVGWDEKFDVSKLRELEKCVANPPAFATVPSHCAACPTAKGETDRMNYPDKYQPSR